MTDQPIIVGQQVRVAAPHVVNGLSALKYTVIAINGRTASLRAPSLPGLRESRNLIERPVGRLVDAS